MCDYYLLSQAALQEFAWTERPRDRILADRATECSTDVQTAAVLTEPVFCFETACKALYWSILVYRVQARPMVLNRQPDAALSRSPTCCDACFMTRQEFAK
jgi:hypothetical protein